MNQKENNRNFRVLTASDYLKHFASDRSHMVCFLEINRFFRILI